MRSGAVQLSSVSMLSLSLVACSPSSTTAYCVDGHAPVSSLQVVPDRYCDNGGSYGRYYWYYGGRYRSGYVSSGSRYRPSRVRIVSRGGRVISSGRSSVSRGSSGSRGSSVSRGGFGNRSSGSRGG